MTEEWKYVEGIEPGSFNKTYTPIYEYSSWKSLVYLTGWCGGHQIVYGITHLGIPGGRFHRVLALFFGILRCIYFFSAPPVGLFFYAISIYRLHKKSYNPFFIQFKREEKTIYSSIFLQKEAEKTRIVSKEFAKRQSFLQMLKSIGNVKNFKSENRRFKDYGN